jgi:hypothetical protein
MVNDRAAIALSMLRAHNIMKARVNEQETARHRRAEYREYDLFATATFIS